MTHRILVSNLRILEIVGENDRAEINFKAVQSSANGSKKEYLFGALVGLVRSAYYLQHYQHKIFLSVIIFDYLSRV